MAVAVKQKVRFGPYELDVHSGELWKNGTRLKLQPQPIQILAALLECPGELVTREELQHRLWPNDTFVDFEQGLNTAVKKLRVALCDEAETPKFIETLPKRGYRFIGEITPDLAKEVIQIIPSPPQSQSQRLSSPRRRWLWISLAAVAVLLGAMFTIPVVFPKTPRIVNSRQLTHTHLQKQRCFLATDGSRVYFQEHSSSDRWTISQVSVYWRDNA